METGSLQTESVNVQSYWSPVGPGCSMTGVVRKRTPCQETDMHMGKTGRKDKRHAAASQGAASSWENRLERGLPCSLWWEEGLAHTLIWDFQPPEQGKNRFLWFKSCNSLYLVLPGDSAVKGPSTCSAGATGDTGLIPGSGRSPGGGQGNPLQYSYLENPMDRGAWRAAVHAVTKSLTQLKQLGLRAAAVTR